VHEVQPDIPAGIRSRLATEVKIPVAVRVNERGRVLSAQVEDTSGSADGLHRYLVGQAEKAAREWQFTPARTRTGIPIPSDKTIQFVITP
jgi:outer membrane biosynthesis protein TonB